VKIKKSATSTPQAWSIAELGAFYTEHNFELKAHANRILKDSTRADEVVQDAFIKVMLAAPELTSADHALSYLHRTIENICIDLFRAEGRRPNLVVLDEAQAEVEAQWQTSGDHSQQISAAEDAAIIRQALALLSPAERTALVMWEMDGRTTAEIAVELGIKESSVRHTVSRARASLRIILSTLIIDEERGLTALDLLSTSYKKAAEFAKKSSHAALSLFMVVGAFLGFHAFTGHEAKFVAPTPSITIQTPAPVAPATPSRKAVVVAASSRQAEIQSLTEQLQFARVELGAQVDLLNVINETNVFGTNTKTAALTIQPTTPAGGGSN
jgi:RNA polymerase sigma factor (sigma-70 family)